MPNITPFLWFDDQAEEAAKFYVSIFKNSKIEKVSHYGEGGPMPAGTPLVIDFLLDGQEFMAINGGTTGAAGGLAPGSIALFVNCETQAEVDRLWEKLSEGGEKGQCGWLIDKYGFNWNVVPAGLMDYVFGPDQQRANRAMEAMMKMQKLNIEELRRAYEN